MPALDTTNSEQMDLSEPHTTTCTVPHTLEPRFTAAAQFDEGDFLTWSSRQKDAENILEYDERHWVGQKKKGADSRPRAGN